MRGGKAANVAHTLMIDAAIVAVDVLLVVLFTLVPLACFPEIVCSAIFSLCSPLVFPDTSFSEKIPTSE